MEVCSKLHALAALPPPIRPYLLNWRLGGRQGWCERFEDGAVILPLPGMATRIDLDGLVAALNTLFQLCNKANLRPNVSLYGLTYIAFCFVKCGPSKKII